VKKSRGRSKSAPPKQTGKITEPTVEIPLAPGVKLLPLVIFSLTLAAFIPAIQNGFVNWDDDHMIYENPFYRGLGWTQISWMFTTFHMGHYQPLSWLSLGLDYLVWEMEAFGYHLTSLVLHAGNAVLFYLLALRLLRLSEFKNSGETRLRIAACFSALAFSVHPLRVESVAWVTERRDVLSGFFLLSCVLCYLRAVLASSGTKYKQWLGAAIVLYAFSLLSKAVGMTLPLLLLIMDIYPLRRLTGGPAKWFTAENRSLWWEKLPFFILAFITGVIALNAQSHVAALKNLGDYGLLSRLVQAIYGLGFYLWKTIVPVRLSPLYELPTDFSAADWHVLLSASAALIVTVILFAVRRWWPAGLTVWVCYAVAVAPMLGVAQSGVQLVADRYSYLPCLGFAVLAGAGMAYSWKFPESDRSKKIVFLCANIVAATLVVSAGILTWRQTQVWHDSETLWRHALEIDPKASVAHLNLGQQLTNTGRAGEAMEQFQEALQIDPNYAAAHVNLGRILAMVGKTDEAAKHFRQLLQSNPNFAEGHNDLANALVKQGNTKEAIEHYRIALQIDPGYEIASNNLGRVLAESNKISDAIKQFQYSVRINPGSADAHFNLARVLSHTGDLDSAIRHYRETVKINPADSEAHNHLGTLLAQQGNLPQALDHFRQALAAKPDSVEAYHNLGRGEAAQGNLTEAAEHLRRAVQMDPEFAPAHENLARVLLAQGKQAEAAKHLEEALRILRSRSAAKRRP
jgi:protein O-mannosyl-transferase